MIGPKNQKVKNSIWSDFPMVLAGKYRATTIGFPLECRAGQYQRFHITIIMTVNIPIIDIIAISDELTVTVLQALKL